MGKAVFFNIPATGHVNPSLSLVRELIARGEEVFYFNSEEMRASIESSGATFLSYPDLEDAELGKAVRRMKEGSLPDNALALHQMALGYLPSCLDWLDRERPDYVIHDAGKKTDLESLRPIPDNFLVRHFVPQLPLLERSDLFITHAGMNSAHEALWYGVPMVAIPQQLEQAIVARQIEESGAGIALATTPPFGRVTASALREAVGTVFDDRGRYQSASRQLGESLRTAGGPARGAELILERETRGQAKRKN